MLYKSLFIVHGVKRLFKSYAVVENKAPQFQKWAWHAHIDLLQNATFKFWYRDMRFYCANKLEINI